MKGDNLSRKAKLTIGVPAYQNEKTIKATLESILAQTYGDFKVIISDDVSHDGTSDICREVAAGDGRITFVQQPKNLNYGNFRWLVKAADTEYFMWLAGDDKITPQYVEENLRILEARSDVVLSVSKCMFTREGQEIGLSGGTYPLMGSIEENLLRYIYRPCENSRMYGIFRTAVLKEVFPESDFFGYDFTVSACSLLYGKHYEIPRVMLIRDFTPRECRPAMMYRDGRTFLTRWFPVLALTRSMVVRRDFPRSWRIEVALLSMNIYHHYAVMKEFHPKYARILQPIISLWDEHVAWRANPWTPEEIEKAVDGVAIAGTRKLS